MSRKINPFKIVEKILSLSSKLSKNPRLVGGIDISVKDENFRIIFSRSPEKCSSDITDLMCCANCDNFDCPHRDIASKTPCTEEEDSWRWEMFREWK